MTNERKLTPVQAAIQRVNQIQAVGDNDFCGGMRHGIHEAMKLLISLLPEEKKFMSEVFKEGGSQMVVSGDSAHLKTFEQFYSQYENDKS